MTGKQTAAREQARQFAYVVRVVHYITARTDDFSPCLPDAVINDDTCRYLFRAYGPLLPRVSVLKKVHLQFYPVVGS